MSFVILSTVLLCLLSLCKKYKYYILVIDLIFNAFYDRNVKNAV